MKTKIWLSSPHMGGNERKFVTEAFDSNWVAPLGPNVNGLEVDITSFLYNDIHVAALSSGTAALHLALILLGVEEGDEVICQSMTFSASANPIRYQRAWWTPTLLPHLLPPEFHIYLLLPIFPSSLPASHTNAPG